MNKNIYSTYEEDYVDFKAAFRQNVRDDLLAKGFSPEAVASISDESIDDDFKRILKAEVDKMFA